MYYSTSQRTSDIARKIFKGWGMDSIHSIDGSITYGDGRIDFPLFSPQSTSYGDYCGCAYTRSNQEALCEILDAIEAEKGIEIYHVAHEAYGTRSIHLYPRAFAFAEVREALQAIADYPILDEDRASEIEQELIVEAWENYARADFRAALENAVPEGFWQTETVTGGEGKSLADLDSLNPLDYPGTGWDDDRVCPWEDSETVGPDADEIIGLLTDDQIDEIWAEALDALGRYPEEEGYGSFIFPLEEAAAALDWADDIEGLLPARV